MRFAVPIFALGLILASHQNLHAERAFGTVTVPKPTATPPDSVPNSPVTFAVAANTSDPTQILEYSWNFGDAVTSTPFSPTAASISHSYAAVGHYTVTVSVREVGTTPLTPPTNTVDITIHRPIPALLPTASSTILFDKTNSKVWVVNADQDTVTRMNPDGTGLLNVDVGRNPRTIAQAADGTIWVASQQNPTVSVIDPLTGAVLHVIALPHASLPYGVCMTPDGSAAYVSLQSSGIVKISTSSRAVIASNSQPKSARGVAVTSDGRVLVTRFISPQSDPLLPFQHPTFTTENRGEVYEFDANLNFVRRFDLPLDAGVAGPDPDFGAGAPGPFAPANGSRGVPNYLTSLVINPDGRTAMVPSKKDNIQRGVKTPERDGRVPGSEITYRAIVSMLDLVANNVPPTGRLDLDNSEMPQAALFSPFGDYLFIALQGNNSVVVRDVYAGFTAVNGINGTPTGSTATNGLSPQGLALDPAGKKLYVNNYMARTVTILDVSGILDRTTLAIPNPAPADVITIVPPGSDKLGATVLLGKQIFYNAGDSRMSLNGYISCAGCHLDGGSDMRVWDFTNRTEGFRNTVMLQGRGGVKQGNVHWSANFNEIQDFENDIQNAFGGTGFSGGAPNPPMGTANTNRPAPGSDLDALAAYVASLTKVSRSPFRNADGTLSAAGARGEAVFETLNCKSCHGGREFSDSGVFVNANLTIYPPSLHDVGTLKPTSGNRLGQSLPGIDTPTLKGLWQTAPYFHDGSAATIMDVINRVPTDKNGNPISPNAHGGMHLLNDQDKADLAEYMLEIDELDAPPAPNSAPTVRIDSVSTGKPYSLALDSANALPYIDRSYQFVNSPASGYLLLRTSEDDKNVTTTQHIQLTVPANTVIYIAYDSRGTLPDWISATYVRHFTFDETFIGQPGVTMQYWRSPPMPAGQVWLGGNLAPGAVGALRNYTVIIGPNGGFPPLPTDFNEGPLNGNEWAHDQDSDGDGIRDEFEAVSGLNPFKTDTANAGVPDEDQAAPGGGTFFSAQPAYVAFSVTGSTSTGGGSSGGGGCGLLGLEYLLPLLFAAGAARRLRKR